MSDRQSLLIIGESDVGKTHYGAQVLKRLITDRSELKMDGMASNLEPFEAAMESLNSGRSAAHTPRGTYVESVWPVISSLGVKGTLVWPDYGGEQLEVMIDTRRISQSWRDRIVSADHWLLMLRLHKIQTSADIFTKPMKFTGAASDEDAEIKVSDQARILELLQILLHVRGALIDRKIAKPKLLVLLTCWDEIDITLIPVLALKDALPLVHSFIEANWASGNARVMGVSALSRALSKSTSDRQFAARGPEAFGYAILDDGERTDDIVEPISSMLATD